MIPAEFQSHAPLIAIATVMVLIALVITWLAALALKNFGIVDAVWSFLFAPVAALYASLGTGNTNRRLLVVGMVAIWSIRLGSYLTRRIQREHPKEDRRYAALRAEWGVRANSRMLAFYLLQGLVIIVLSLPYLLPVFNTDSAFHPLEYLGIGIFLTGLIGESLSDLQLARFKAAKHPSNAVCEVGLWRYSRHPNYFFEWMIWVGFATVALPSPAGWLGLIAPVLMFHFLVNVTGIPMAEELSVVRKGDAYRRYQHSTSRFIPWFRKEI